MKDFATTEHSKITSRDSSFVKNINPSNLKTGLEVLSSKYKDLREFVIKNPIQQIPEVVDLFKETWQRQVLDKQRVSCTKTSGKTYKFRVVTAIGNKKGVLGLGVGKAETINRAIQKSFRASKKNLIAVPLVEINGKEVFKPLRSSQHKLGATKVKVTPLSEGDSVTGCKTGVTYCKLGSVTNLKITTGNKGREIKGRIKSRLNYLVSLHTALKKTCI